MSSPFEWSETQLTDYLVEFGIDNLDMMDRDEKAVLVFSLLQTSDDPDRPVESTNMAVADVADTAAPTHTDFEEDAVVVDTSSSASTAFYVDPLVAEEEERQRAAAVAAAERDSAHYEEAITSVSDITGCDKIEARHLLEAVGWDIEAAINLHMGPGHDPAPAPQIRTPAAPTPMDTNFGDPAAAFLGAPLAVQQQQRGMRGVGFHGGGFGNEFVGMDDDEFFGVTGGRLSIPAGFRNMGAGVGPMMPGFGNMGAAGMAGMMFDGMGHGYPGGYDGAPGGGGRGRREDEYDEEGVRRPDPVKMQRLMHAGGSEEDAALARADAPHVEWMFPQPSHISYPGPLQEAREMAKSEKKWLIVNIQSHEDFSSHMLNRDTWSDETVVSLLRTSFTFWQRGHTSPDGQAYMRLHGITDADLPHIAIIDSRTGARIVTMKGFVSQSELSMALLEYLDENNFDNPKPPKNRFIDSTKDFDRNVSLVDGSHKSRIQDDGDDDENEYVDDQERAGDDDSYLYRGNSGTATAAAGSGYSFAAAAAAAADIPPAAPEETRKLPALDYGIVPDEPEAGDVDSLKVSLKLISGKSVVRRFKKSDTVRVLYAFALSLTPEAVTDTRDFDVFTTYPPKCLRESIDVTVQEAGLAGSQVIVRWV